MRTEIELSRQDAVERAKELLGVSEDIPLVELCEQVAEHRNANHPDRFQDPAAKAAAEERFKEIGQLLDDLQKHLERERLSLPGSKLAIMQPKFDLLDLRLRLARAIEDARQKQSEADLYKYRYESIEKELAQERDKGQKEQLQQIMELYRPSRGSILKMGLGLLLTSLLGVMSRIEEIGKVLQRYAPFEPSHLNATLFFLFVLLLIGTLHRYLKHVSFQGLVRLVCTSRFSRDFVRWLREKAEVKLEPSRFSEGEALEYVQNVLKAQRSIRFLSRFLWLELLSEQTIDALKDAFIHSLLSKHLIEGSAAQGLERFFLIKGSQKNRYLDIGLPF